MSATISSKIKFRMVREVYPLLILMATICIGAGPALEVPATREAWQTQRAELLKQWQQIIGPLPAPAGPVGGTIVVSSEELADHTRLLIRDKGIEAYLLLPKTPG